MQDFNDQKPFFSRSLIFALIAFVILGSLAGMFVAKTNGKVGPLNLKTLTSAVHKGQTYGSSDTATFKDTAEGVLKEGGIGDEGQYHLVRPGGDSQNVYLTSSNVDLAQFIDRKVKVWGQTQKAQKAGWLMDVGRVEVLQ